MAMNMEPVWNFEVAEQVVNAPDRREPVAFFFETARSINSARMTPARPLSE
jgi:hypothetical protein